MSTQRTFRWLPALTLLAVVLLAQPAAAQKKIYIVTDLEGISGVYKFTQTRETDTPLAIKAREYFMGDLAAVVRGLRAGGATEILVFDGHGNQAFVPDLMEPGAKYATGQPKKFMEGLDKTYAGMVALGYHAMMGTPGGVLNHTQSSKTENRYWYNGVESGELAQVGAIAGHYGVPPILVTGDDATCREARKFYGDACVTVSVKQGLSREAAVLYPFAETRQALFDGAKRAMAAIPKCKPYTITVPIQAKKQYLEFDKKDASKPPKLVTKEATITDILHLLDL
jgi:D-amino peptidase